MSPRLTVLLDHYPNLEPCVPEIEKAFVLLRDMYTAGHKVLICGNGGSAADADHISGELLKGFQSLRPLTEEHRRGMGAELADQLQQSLPAIPLTSFPALTSAVQNDLSGEVAFAQLTLGLGQKGDVLWGISTSGNAVNVCHALRVARSKGLGTLGLTGETGGRMKELCDVCIQVPERETFRVQEHHLPIYHCLCLMLEDEFFSLGAT